MTTINNHRKPDITLPPLTITSRHDCGATLAPIRPPLDGNRLPSWRFVIFIDRVPDKNQLQALKHGATFLEDPYDPSVRIRFDWPAPTQIEAIAAAIQRVETAGPVVLRVDNDDLATTGDIAHRIFRSRETVRLWASGTKGPGGFPPPANPRRDTTFYSWAEVLPWLRERQRLDLPEEDPSLVAADLAMRLRALLPRLPKPELILDLLHDSYMRARA